MVFLIHKAENQKEREREREGERDLFGCRGKNVRKIKRFN